MLISVLLLYVTNTASLALPLEEFEDTKGVIRICISQNRQQNGQTKKTEEQTTQWPNEKDGRTDNTIAKRKRQKNRQHNGQTKRTEEQTTQWPNEKDRRTDNTMVKR